MRFAQGGEINRRQRTQAMGESLILRTTDLEEGNCVSLVDIKPLQEQEKNADLTEAFPRVGSGLASTHYSLT